MTQPSVCWSSSRRAESKDATFFPELRPTNRTQKFGDVFYKPAWVNIRAKGGLSPKADIHGARHRFSTALKDQRMDSP